MTLLVGSQSIRVSALSNALSTTDVLLKPVFIVLATNPETGELNRPGPLKPVQTASRL